MCGIVGLAASPGAEPPAEANIARLLGALRHRGPDGSGVHVDGAVAIGHTRLSIVDVPGGRQPLYSEDGSVAAVVNGEIWNHAELRRDLERAGHVFRTRSDCEVVVHGYEAWGDGVLDRLDGMFALALRDRRRDRLLLARDRVGKKPLYVARSPRGLGFSSDARLAAAAAGLEPRLDETALPEWLFQRYLAGPGTLLRGVERLPPGGAVAWDAGGTRAWRYWELRPGPAHRVHPAEVRALLEESVRKRLMADVPLGVFLSGGVDSAAVLALAARGPAGPPATFTIGFEDGVFDERPLARAAAAAAGSEHHELVVGAADLEAALPELAWYRDEPVAEPSELPLYLLAREASRHVKVVLTGDGGDELFGGYPKYRAERLLRLPVPGAAAALRLAVRAMERRPSHRRLARAAASLAIPAETLRWASWFRTFGHDELAALLTPELAPLASPDALVAPLARRLAPYSDLDPGRRMVVADFLGYLPENMLLRSDKVLMAASVEGRMPLLDRALVERVHEAPIRQRAGLRSGKRLLRRAVSDLVPEELLAAPKRGFPVPIAGLLGGRSGLLERLALSERALSRGLLRPEAVRALAAAHGDPDRELKLFALASLELWLRLNVDEPRHAAPAPATAAA